MPVPVNAHSASAPAVSASLVSSVPACSPETVPTNVAPPPLNWRMAPLAVVSVASVWTEGLVRRNSPPCTSITPALSNVRLPPLTVDSPLPDLVTMPVGSLANVPSPVEPMKSPAPVTLHTAAFSTRPPP